MKRIKSYLIDAQTLIEGLESTDESSKGEELDTLWSLIESKRIEVLILAEEWETLKRYLYDKVSSRKRAEAILDSISKSIKVSSKDKDKGLKLITLSRIAREREGDSASVEAIIVQHSSVSRDPSTLVLESFFSIAALWLTKVITEIQSKSDEYITTRINALFDVVQLPELDFQAFIDRHLNTQTEAEANVTTAPQSLTKAESEGSNSDASPKVGAIRSTSDILEDWDTLISAINSPGEGSGVTYEAESLGARNSSLSSSEAAVIDSDNPQGAASQVPGIPPGPNSETQGTHDVVEAIGGTESAANPNEPSSSKVDDDPPASATPDVIYSPLSPDDTLTLQEEPDLDDTDLAPGESFPVSPTNFYFAALPFITTQSASELSDGSLPLGDGESIEGEMPISLETGLPQLVPAYGVTAESAEIGAESVEVEGDSEILIVFVPDAAISDWPDNDIDQASFVEDAPEDTLISGDSPLLTVADDDILIGGTDIGMGITQSTNEISDMPDFDAAAPDMTDFDTAGADNLAAIGSYNANGSMLDGAANILAIAPVWDAAAREAAAMLILYGPSPV
ncbi:MAG: hypothetical protein ACFBSF_05520 [Leptolyngbyaceae cyanobacterium]